MRSLLLVLLFVSAFASTANAVDLLDATIPANSALISTFAGTERETRAKVNEIIENIPDIANWEMVTVAYTASSGEKLLVNTSAAPCTITLPASPTEGSYVYLADAKGTWSSYNVTLARNGKMIAGAASDYTLNTSGIYFLMYVDAGYGWTVASAGGGTSFGASLRFMSSYSYANLGDLINLIGPTPVILVIDEASTLSTNTNVPITMKLSNVGGNTITIAAGRTLTFDNPGQIQAAEHNQIFAGDGLVVFTNPGTVYPDWWQTNTEGTDMAPAINKAMIAGGAGSTIKFNAGVYLLETISKCEDLPACGQDAYLENYFVNLLDDRTIKCEGWGSVIKVGDHIFDQSDDDTSNAHVFQGFDIENVLIEGCFIDMNGYNNLTPSGKTRNAMAVRLDDGGSNVMIKGLYVLNNPGHNNIAANNTAAATQAKGLTVTDCVMYGGGSGLIGNIHNVDFSFIYSEWSHTIVSNNRLEQPIPSYTWSGGIELHDSDSQATNNVITYCDPGVWIGSNQQTGAVDISQIVVSDNVMKDCARGIAFWSSGVIRDVIISNNNIGLRWRGDGTNYLVSNDVYGVHMIYRGKTYPWTDTYAAGAPLHNISILGNIFKGEDNATRYDFFGGVGILAASVHGLNVKGNSFRNLPGNGVLVMGSPYGVSNVVIQENYFKNWGRSTYGYGKNAIQLDVSGGPAISWDTEEEIPDAGAFKIRHAIISGNMFSKDDNSTDVNGTTVSSYAVTVIGEDATPGQVEDITIKDNIDWLCMRAGTCTAAVGGNLVDEENHIESGVVYTSFQDFVLGTENPNDLPPAGWNVGGMIGWNRHSLGSPAGVTAGRPIGYVNTTPGETPHYEPFGVIGAWKIGAFADRPSAVTTDLGLVYMCTDCKCRPGIPSPIWFIHKVGEDLINMWYCDNGTAVIGADPS